MTRTTVERPPTRARRLNTKGIHVSQACTINRPAAELFRFWRHFENLPQFMLHLESVTTIDERVSHWKAKAPFAQEVQWDAEVIAEEPGRLISWRSLQGAEVENAGTVRFTETADRGTEVHVTMDYVPPAGKFGNMLAKLIGEDPSSNLREELRRFKQLMEAGELATPQGPRGSCKSDQSATSERSRR